MMKILKIKNLLSASAFLFALFVFYSCSETENSGTPNILLILVDDMGYTGISCFGEKPWESHNIDKIAAEGMRFTDAYASPVCSPTRASILTGKNAARLDITNWIPGGVELYANPKLIEKPFKQWLPLEEFTIAEAFKSNGYATAHVGKWHMGEGLRIMPDKQGFDYSYMCVWSNTGRWFVGKEHNQVTGFYRQDAPERQFLTEHLTDKAIHWLNGNQERPFFMYFSTHAVHTPIAAKDSVLNKYLDQGMPEKGVDAADYAAMHEHMDHAIGRLLKHVEMLGLSDNTIVMFLSDNGGREPQTVNTPLRGGKGELLEGGVRVPLIVKWPGKIQAGSVSEALVSTDDFYPTLLELAGLETIPEQHVDGISFAKVLTGEAESSDRDAIYWHYPHYTSKKRGQPSSAVRKGDWKLIEFFEDGGTWELYNIKNDIGESANIINENPKIAKELKTMLENWRLHLNAKIPTPNPDYDPDLPSGWPEERAR